MLAGFSDALFAATILPLPRPSKRAAVSPPPIPAIPAIASVMPVAEYVPWFALPEASSALPVPGSSLIRHQAFGLHFASMHR